MSDASQRWREHVPLVVLLGATAVVLSILGPTVWVVLLTDGVLPVVLVAAACGWGAWPTAWLGPGGRDALQQFCIAAALGLGIIGEYIGRIYQEVRRRPRFVIREVLEKPE